MIMLEGLMVIGGCNDGSLMVDDWSIDGLLWLIDGCFFPNSYRGS